MRIPDPHDPMIDYQIRDVVVDTSGVKSSFEITKWAHGRVPETSYKVRESTSGRFTCTCPAFRATCKHVEMVQRYLLAGRPATFPRLEVLDVKF